MCALPRRMRVAAEAAWVNAVAPQQCVAEADLLCAQRPPHAVVPALGAERAPWQQRAQHGRVIYSAAAPGHDQTEAGMSSGKEKEAHAPPPLYVSRDKARRMACMQRSRTVNAHLV